MATVINNPSHDEGSNDVMGMVVGIIILLVVAGLFFVYILPAMQNLGTQKVAPDTGNIDLNVTLPAVDTAPTDNTNN